MRAWACGAEDHWHEELQVIIGMCEVMDMMATKTMNAT